MQSGLHFKPGESNVSAWTPSLFLHQLTHNMTKDCLLNYQKEHELNSLLHNCCIKNIVNTYLHNLGSKGLCLLCFCACHIQKHVQIAVHMDVQMTMPWLGNLWYVSRYSETLIKICIYLRSPKHIKMTKNVGK